MPPAGKKRRSGAPRLDAANLRGFTTLMNPQHVRQNQDLRAAEMKIIGHAPASAAGRAPDAAEMFKEEMRNLADDLGIEGLLDDESVGGARPAAGPIAPALPALRRSSSGSSRGRRDGGRRAGRSDYSDRHSDRRDGRDDRRAERWAPREIPRSRVLASPPSTEESSESSERSDTDTGSSRVPDNEVESVISQVNRDFGIDLDEMEHASRRHRTVAAPAAREKYDTRLRSLTEEQERRAHVSSVMADMRGERRTAVGLDREREQDIKNGKLEQIGSLKMALTEEGIDCAAVGSPTAESSMEQIDAVLGVLRRKNDCNRYSSLAEEGFMGAAEMLETVFDGSRKIPFFNVRPDFTGYHSTVNVKLHRMRYETSQLVGGVVEKFNLGSMARIMLEILPSLIVYPRQQKRFRDTSGLHSELDGAESRRAAINAINNSDRKNELDIIDRI